MEGGGAAGWRVAGGIACALGGVATGCGAAAWWERRGAVASCAKFGRAGGFAGAGAAACIGPGDERPGGCIGGNGSRGPPRPDPMGGAPGGLGAIAATGRGWAETRRGEGLTPGRCNTFGATPT